MSWKQLRERYKQKQRVVFSEIPVMVSQSGKLICIEVKRDRPTIGIIGVKSSGKSRFLHSLVDFVYHKRKEDKLLILNDQHDETLTWSLKGKKWNPQQYKSVTDNLWVRQMKEIGMKPMRLPVVHCYPAITESFEEAPENISKLQIALSHENLFMSEQLFDDNLAGSAKHLRRIKPLLMKCNSEEEINQLLNKEIMIDSVREKLGLLINNIFQEKIVSFSDEYVSKAFFFDEKTNKKVVMPILNALMAVRCIPVLMTKSIQNSKYYSTYLKMILEDIFDRQKKGYFAENRVSVWLFIDEITGIDSVGERHKDTGMTKIMQRLVTEGRPSRIGTVWATQNYVKVRDKIRSNTQYLISFRMNTDEEVKTIMRDFSLTESQADSIKKLDKDSFECVAITSEYFIAYDLKTGERTQVTGFVRGYSLPPMSMHKQPESELPNSNLQYAVLHLMENKIKVGNYLTGRALLRSLTEGYKNWMRYRELGETSFVPDDFDLSLFLPSKSEIVVISYDELKTYGYDIYARIIINPLLREFKQQRVSYWLKPIGNRVRYGTVMTYCPQDLVIEMNPFIRRVRIRGPNVHHGVSEWREIHG